MRFDDYLLASYVVSFTSKRNDHLQSKSKSCCTLKLPSQSLAKRRGDSASNISLDNHPSKQWNSKFEMLFYLDFILHRRLSSPLERPHNITLNHQAKYRRLRYLVWITYNMLFNHAKCHRHGKCRQGCSAYTPKLPCEQIQCILQNTRNMKQDSLLLLSTEGPIHISKREL